MPFVFLAVCWTVVAAFVTLTVQQNYRQSANDPQIQDVEDISTALNAGQEQALLQYLQPDGTDVSSSLSTFIALYDSKGAVLGANVTLNGSAPQLPSGVFAYADKHGEDRFTWQPQKGERFAVVVKKNSQTNEYVAAGRSLKEIEARETALYGMAAIAWVLLLLISMLGCYTVIEGCPCPRCIKKRNGTMAESIVCECGHEHKHHKHTHTHSADPVVPSPNSEETK